MKRGESGEAAAAAAPASAVAAATIEKEQDPVVAAVKIQSTFRGFKTRKELEKTNLTTKKAKKTKSGTNSNSNNTTTK